MKNLISESMAGFQQDETEYLPLNQYPQGDTAEELTAVVEIPQGSMVKYKMDEEGNIMVDRFQSMPVVYPANYGSLTQTAAGDGDPLDVLIYTRSPLIF